MAGRRQTEGRRRRRTHCTPWGHSSSQERYGKDNAEDIAAIKDLYKSLGLEKAFEEYEAESYAKLQKLIAQEPEEYLRQAYGELLGKIYKRAK